MQIQASNRPWVLKIHVFGAERIGKKAAKSSQVRITELNESEQS